jgi:hypothetical protein
VLVQRDDRQRGRLLGAVRHQLDARAPHLATQREPVHPRDARAVDGEHVVHLGARHRGRGAAALGHRPLERAPGQHGGTRGSVGAPDVEEVPVDPGDRPGPVGHPLDRGAGGDGAGPEQVHAHGGIGEVDLHDVRHHLARGRGRRDVPVRDAGADLGHRADRLDDR